MFSGLTIWSWITTWCDLAQRRLFLLLSKFLSCRKFSVCGSALMGFPSSTLASPIAVIHVQQSCWWDIMFVDSDVTGRPKSHSRHPNPLALITFLLPLPQWSLHLRYMGCIIDASIGTGLLQLWVLIIYHFPLVVSVCYKEKLLLWGLSVNSSLGI